MESNVMHEFNRILLCEATVVFLVEDKQKEGEYEFLFKKIFNELNNVDFKVFAMNGKEGVKNIYEYIQHASIDNEKYLFLVDGDFEILRNDYSNICSVYGEHFCFLEKYDIENYLVDKNEINNYLMINCNATNDNLLNKIDYNYWYKNVEKHLGALFLLFFALYQFKIDKSNYKMPEHIGKYCHISLTEDGIPTEEKICKCRDNIINEFCKLNNGYDKNDFIKIIEKYEKQLAKKFSKNIFDNISGKYLLHSIVLYIKSIKDGCMEVNKSSLKGAIDEFEMRKFLMMQINNCKFEFLFNKWHSIIHKIIYNANNK